MFFKKQFKIFLIAFFNVLNIKTNKQSLVFMSEANTPKTSLCAPLIKLYKMLLHFALGPLISDILKNNFYLQLASGLNRIVHGSWINLSRE